MFSPPSFFLAKDFLDERPWSVAFQDPGLGFLFQAVLFSCSEWFREMEAARYCFPKRRELCANRLLVCCASCELPVFSLRLCLLGEQEERSGSGKIPEQLGYQERKGEQ